MNKQIQTQQMPSCVFLKGTSNCECCRVQTHNRGENKESFTHTTPKKSPTLTHTPRTHSHTDTLQGVVDEKRFNVRYDLQLCVLNTAPSTSELDLRLTSLENGNAYTPQPKEKPTPQLPLQLSPIQIVNAYLFCNTQHFYYSKTNK